MRLVRFSLAVVAKRPDARLSVHALASAHLFAQMNKKNGQYAAVGGTMRQHNFWHIPADCVWEAIWPRLVNTVRWYLFYEIILCGLLTTRFGLLSFKSLTVNVLGQVEKLNEKQIYEIVPWEKLKEKQNLMRNSYTNGKCSCTLNTRAYANMWARVRLLFCARSVYMCWMGVVLF